MEALVKTVALDIIPAHSMQQAVKPVKLESIKTIQSSRHVKNAAVIMNIKILQDKAVVKPAGLIQYLMLLIQGVVQLVKLQLIVQEINT